MPQDTQIAYIGLLYLAFLVAAGIILRSLCGEMVRVIGDKSSLTESMLLFEDTPTNYDVPRDYRGLRLTEDVHAALKAWAAQQPGKPSLSDAIERLIEIGVSD